MTREVTTHEPLCLSVVFRHLVFHLQSVANRIAPLPSAMTSVSAVAFASSLTAKKFGNTFRTGFPQPPGPGGRVFLGQNTHGERKKKFPHPRVYVFCPRPCMRTWCACIAVATGALSRRAQMCGGTILLESPRQSTLETYHARRHPTPRGHRASLGARAGSGVDLAVARAETCEMKSFAGTQALVRVMHREQCWRVQRSGWCLRRSTHGATALFTGNGPD